MPLFLPGPGPLLLAPRENIKPVVSVTTVRLLASLGVGT